jgi:hypothetical protein
MEKALRYDGKVASPKIIFPSYHVRIENSRQSDGKVGITGMERLEGGIPHSDHLQ